jgi:Helix-turn-helix
MTTHATESLSAWFKATGTGQSQLAERLGVSKSLISHILKGRRRFNRDVAAVLEEITSGEVPASAWGHPDNHGRQAADNPGAKALLGYCVRHGLSPSALGPLVGVSGTSMRNIIYKGRCPTNHTIALINHVLKTDLTPEDFA